MTDERKATLARMKRGRKLKKLVHKERLKRRAFKKLYGKLCRKYNMYVESDVDGPIVRTDGHEEDHIKMLRVPDISAKDVAGRLERDVQIIEGAHPQVVIDGAIFPVQGMSADVVITDGLYPKAFHKPDGPTTPLVDQYVYGHPRTPVSQLPAHLLLDCEPSVDFSKMPKEE